MSECIVLDPGWQAREVLAAAGWLAQLLAVARLVLVCRPTVPAVRQAERLLGDLRRIRPVLLAAPGSGRWPGAVTASCGPAMRAAREAGRVVTVPLDRRLEVDGVTADPLPRPIAQAFTHADPDVALATLVGVFARFWGADRLVMRRLRALAALDPDVAKVIAARDERRRSALEVLLERRTDVPDRARALRAAHMLTSFETFDALLDPDQDPAGAVPLVVGLTTTAIASTAPVQPRRRRADRGGSSTRRGG